MSRSPDFKAFREIFVGADYVRLQVIWTTLFRKTHGRAQLILSLARQYVKDNKDKPVSAFYTYVLAKLEQSANRGRKNLNDKFAGVSVNASDSSGCNDRASVSRYRKNHGGGYFNGVFDKSSKPS